jgi:flavodoxin
MNESKELLEATVKGLEEKINQLADDLTGKRKELADVSKPEMTGEMFDTIQELVEEGINNYNFNDTDNYTFEYELDYDNKISTHGVEFESANEVGESIMNKIDGHFKISTSEDIK